MSGYLFLLPPTVLLGLAAVVILTWLVIRVLRHRRHKGQDNMPDPEQEETDPSLES